MKNDNEFVNEIWNKYDLYSNSRKKDKFFNKHLYKNTDYMINIRAMLTFIVVFISTIGMVYATGVTTYNFFQKELNYDVREDYEDDYMDSFEIIEGFFCKKITTYNEYIKLKDVLDIVEMTEEDFQNYFVLILIGGHYDTTGLYVSNVSADNNTLYIDLNKKEKWNEERISLKISNSLNRDNLKIINHPNIPDTSSKYMKLEEIPKDYTSQQAVEDSCFVLVERKIVSEDKDMLKNFIKNCENGIEGIIRVYEVDSLNPARIIDVEYKNERFNMCILFTEDGKEYYSTGKTIDEFKDLSGEVTYSITNEMGEHTFICSIEE